jgi:hypothetical protein
MRNLLFSVFAIGVAAVAAMTATTACSMRPRNAPQPWPPARETRRLRSAIRKASHPRRRQYLHRRPSDGAAGRRRHQASPAKGRQDPTLYPRRSCRPTCSAALIPA